jgi:hypothetical protein
LCFHNASDKFKKKGLQYLQTLTLNYPELAHTTSITA